SCHNRFSRSLHRQKKLPSKQKIFSSFIYSSSAATTTVFFDTDRGGIPVAERRDQTHCVLKIIKLKGQTKSQTII
ncbi:hypothetical protein FF38_11709, partial [Lucilia cuprina]